MQESGAEGDPRVVPWGWIVILLGVTAMMGTMLVMVTTRWVRRVFWRRGQTATKRPLEQEPVDAWRESGRRVEAGLDPTDADGEADEEDDEGGDRPTG